MLTIDVKFQGLDEVKRQIAAAEKQAHFAAAVALTRTAQAIQKAEEAEVSRVFDRPTAFTRKAFGIKRADKVNLTAEVFVKDKQADYLKPEILGGTRRQKAYERRGFGGQSGYWVPGAGLKLTASGNMSLAQVKALGEALNRRGKFGRVVFLPARDGKAAGLYGAKDGRGKRARGRLVPLLLQASTPSYQPRFRFYEVGIKIANAEFRRQFDRAFAEAMRTAR